MMHKLPCVMIQKKSRTEDDASTKAFLLVFAPSYSHISQQDISWIIHRPAGSLSPHFLHYTDMDSKKDIFDTPELVRMIARHLDGSKSMVNCLRVCRRWYKSFLPYNFESVTLSSRSMAPVRDSLVKFSPFIHKITLYSARACNLPATFPFLTDLTSHFDPIGWGAPSKGSMTAYRNSLRELIKTQQATLQSLTMDSSVDQKLLEAIADCSRLRQFCGQTFTVDCTPEQYLEIHSRLWAHVEDVQINGEFMTQKKCLTLTQAIKAQKTLPPTKIKRLKISDPELRMKSMGVPLLLVVTSPELTRLTWYAREDIYVRHTQVFPMQILAKAAKARALNCPRLQELIFEYGSFQSDDFVLVMGALLSVTKLELSHVRYGFDMECAKALTTNFPTFRTTLKELRLPYCGLSGSVILEILASLSGLEVFLADVVNSTALSKDDRPWVCLGMRELVLGFSQDEDSADAKGLFLERLVQLEKLESLSLDGLDYNGKKGLRLTAEGGLDNLKSLTSLRSFRGESFYVSSHKWGMAEAEWVTRNWRNIKTLSNITFDGEAAKKHLVERNINVEKDGMSIKQQFTIYLRISSTTLEMIRLWKAE